MARTESALACILFESSFERRRTGDSNSKTRCGVVDFKATTAGGAALDAFAFAHEVALPLRRVVTR